MDNVIKYLIVPIFSSKGVFNYFRITGGCKTILGRKNNKLKKNTYSNRMYLIMYLESRQAKRYKCVVLYPSTSELLYRIKGSEEGTRSGMTIT